MKVRKPTEASPPMSAMNMTPLIDVLLVLLIMFIITIPIASHAIEVDVTKSEIIIERPDPMKNKLVITAEDQIMWNGQGISLEELRALLKTTKQMTPEPELRFEPDGKSSYEKSAKVLQVIKLSGVTKFGFVGNERHKSFEREPD